MPPIPPITDYLTAHAINNFTECYVILAILGLVVNMIRFFFYNCQKSNDAHNKIKDLNEQIDNLHNVLEEVVNHLNRTNKNYDEEKAEFVDKDITPANDTKED
jgi:hypothetical protein